VRVAILTNFSYFDSKYSLTGIVFDQARMLSTYSHEVVVYCQEGADMKHYPARDAASYGWRLRDVIPKTNLIDYEREGGLTQEHMDWVGTTVELMKEELKEVDIVFTHDLCLTGWNLPHFKMLEGLDKQFCSDGNDPGPKAWYHWIHSIPGDPRKDWWEFDRFTHRHYLVYPNRSDAMNVVEKYQTMPYRVVVVPHIKDPRSWGGGVSLEMRDFLQRYPDFLQADITQCLPAGQDRLTFKRVPEVMEIFGCMKRRGLNVFLVVANQWATATTHLREMDEYYHLAELFGLERGKDFEFTRGVGEGTRFEEQFKSGIPDYTVREFFGLTNLFIFPTHHESFGLVVPEAALGGNLLVLNKSLQQQIEISGGNALYFEFGSVWQHFIPADKSEYLDAVAARIIQQLTTKESAVVAKTWCRQMYNWDRIYRKYYEPLMVDGRDMSGERFDTSVIKSVRSTTEP
jgi:hypothetical protein